MRSLRFYIDDTSRIKILDFSKLLNLTTEGPEMLRSRTLTFHLTKRFCHSRAKRWHAENSTEKVIKICKNSSIFPNPDNMIKFPVHSTLKNGNMLSWQHREKKLEINENSERSTFCYLFFLIERIALSLYIYIYTHTCIYILVGFQHFRELSVGQIIIFFLCLLI